MTRLARGAGADAVAASARALRAWAREPGRSVMARLAMDARAAWMDARAAWTDGVDPDTSRPAASVLKMPLAMAVEDGFRHGDLDPDARVPVAVLLGADGSAPDPGRTPLRVLRPDATLAADEILGLCLALSDRACATWLVGTVGIGAIRAAIAAAGCEATTAEVALDDPSAPLVGRTTARDALRLIDASVDAAAYPRTAHALRNNVRDSRIPLGATDLDVDIAHKTGSLPGVAHDVAVIDCAGGRLTIAFFTEAQHDTLVSGYEMGICTRTILEAWGLGARATRSLA